MTRIVWGSICVGLFLGVAGGPIRAIGADSPSTQELRLAEFNLYYHDSSHSFIAIRGQEHYFGTTQGAIAFVRGERTERTPQGITVKYTAATSNGSEGLLLYCSRKYEFFAAATEATWSKLPQAKQTVVPICQPTTGGQNLTLPCGLTLKPAAPSGKSAPTSNGSAPRANGSAPRPNGSAPKANGAEHKASGKVVPAGADAGAGAAAPGISLIEGERVQPGEAMVFTRSVLIEEGAAVNAMSEFQENISTVRYNMNNYRIGYSIPAEKVGERWVFSGPVKGWRATSTGDISAWPAFTYPASRNEAMRRAKLLKPMVQDEPIDEMNNLRLYALPSLVGHDGRDYIIEPTALAFLIHPKTGSRMTAMVRAGRTYGSVNAPLAATSQIYVQETVSYPAGFLGIGRARVPSVFYSKTVRFDVQPFAQGDTLDRLMTHVLSVNESGGQVSSQDFRALYTEMTRYTGGKIEYNP
jgi:hypothetical protein